MPDITFVNSPFTEDERQKMTAKVIASGFYEKQGFLVVPELNNDIESSSQVVYPRKADYRSIDVDVWVKNWKKVEQQFWDNLVELLPSASKHGRIQVRLTRYGTVASSAVLGNIDSKNVVYYLRCDVDLSHLAAMIINNVLYHERKQLGITWTKREALMDFIMTRPKIKKLFPKYDPIFAKLSRASKKLRDESRKYVFSLGLVRPKLDFEVVGDRVVIKDTFVTKELTRQESEIMKQMIKKIGDIVTYDDLADIIWGEGEFKSFWAINKTMQRLRSRLGKLGIDKQRLEAIRGQGYLLR